MPYSLVPQLKKKTNYQLIDRPVSEQIGVKTQKAVYLKHTYPQGQ